MAQELINIGVTADDGTGDTIRGAGIKINNNFTELYARPSVASDINVVQNNISTTASNADIVLKPSGTGSVVFPGITIDNNDIKSNRSNDDIKVIPNGSGRVTVDGLAFTQASIIASDSSIININENLVVDGNINAGATTFSAGVTANSTLGVTGATTLSTMTVSGTSSFVGTTTFDNLQFNDNIISSSSNADINLTPGGTGVVNVSNLTIDSSVNLTDNVIKVTRSNDDFVLSANGTGSVQVSKIDMNTGTVDNTVIGGTTPAAATFTTVSLTDTTLTADGVTIADNEIASNRSNDHLEFSGNGTGTVSVNGIKVPSTDGTAGQVLQTDGSGTLTFFTTPILFDNSDITDGTATITADSSTQTIDSFDKYTYRSASYLMQITDSTADRYSLIQANVTHNTSNAYISVFGGVDNGNGDGSSVYDSVEFAADINGDNVRVRASVNNSNNQVIKFVRRIVRG